MTIALDIGTSGIRCLWKNDQQLFGKKCDTRYAILPAEAAGHKLLEHAGAQYTECQDQLVTWGDAGLEIAHYLGYPVQYVLPEGKLPYTNPVARQLISVFIDATVPAALSPQTLCTLTGVSRLQGPLTSRESLFIHQLLQIKGYKLEIVSPGMALGLAELGDHSLTGATLSLGTTHAVFTLMLHGREITTIHLKRGANWIDEQVALATDAYRWNTKGERHLDIISMRNWREDSARSLLNPASEREQILVDRYRDYVRSLINRLMEELRTQRLDPRILREYLPLIVSGGVANIKGFMPLLNNLLSKQKLPVSFDHSRQVPYNPWTLTRGCLIHAELTASQSTQRKSAAA